MPLPPLFTEGLYDGTGRHVGGKQPPLAVHNVLTEEYTSCLADRPAHRLIWFDGVCPDPAGTLGLVWMAPLVDNPLVVAPHILPHLVRALDAGASVKLHAISELAIALTCRAVTPWLGGWWV